MTEPAPLHPLDVETYLEGERYASVKHEYVASRIYAMGGASDRHNLLSGNVYMALRQRLQGMPCQVFMADMKVRIELGSETVIYYPDVFVSCDPADREPYYRTRPCLVVEVLSETTERTDRREKLFTYARIDTLQSYVLVAQDRREVTLHRRANDWRAEHRLGQGSLPLMCADLELTIDEIYRDIA